MPKLLAILTDSEAQTLAETQKNTPAEITGQCQQCGRCCVLWGCPLVDPVTHKCTVYNNRPATCRMFPQKQNDIDAAKCPGFKQTGL